MAIFGVRQFTSAFGPGIEVWHSLFLLHQAVVHGTKDELFALSAQETKQKCI